MTDPKLIRIEQIMAEALARIALLFPQVEPKTSKQDEIVRAEAEKRLTE